MSSTAAVQEGSHESWQVAKKGNLVACGLAPGRSTVRRICLLVVLRCSFDLKAAHNRCERKHKAAKKGLRISFGPNTKQNPERNAITSVISLVWTLRQTATQSIKLQDDKA